MNLYLVHCGFYDENVGDGIYESHVNLFVCAQDFDQAKLKVKALPEFKKHRMHVDGMQEIQVVDGFEVQLKENPAQKGQTKLLNVKYRQLAPPKPTTSATT